MKRLIIVNLFIAILFFTGTAFGGPFEILSQSYHVDGYTTNYSLGITNSFDITQSTPTGWTSITMPGTSYTSGLTFTDGGFMGSESLFVRASGNAYAFAWYTANEDRAGFSADVDAYAIATIVFRPTGTFFMDFNLDARNLWDSNESAELLIDGVKTLKISSSPQGGPISDIYAGPGNEFLGSSPYNARLLVDPSKTYTIIADVDNSYASGGVHGNGIAALTVTAVPEPPSIIYLVLGLGLIWLAGVRTKFNK